MIGMSKSLLTLIVGGCAFVVGDLFFYMISYCTQQLRILPEKIDQPLYPADGHGLDVMLYPFRVLVGNLIFHTEHKEQF